MANNAGVVLEHFPEAAALFEANPAYVTALQYFEIKKAADEIWAHIVRADQFIQRTEPFKKIKIDAEGAKADLKQLLADLWLISSLLTPFMPKTAASIQETLRSGAAAQPLFPRKD